MQTPEEELMQSLQDLHHDPATARKLDVFKVKLNNEPPESWVKKNMYANNAKYLPIDKTEFLLDKIFQDWQVEVLREGIMFNSIYVTVRIHYIHPVLGQWRYHDGVGAHNVQKDADQVIENADGTKEVIKTSLNADSIKDAAIKMALPIAKSEAVKDACDHLGKLFGRDLNRKATIDFKPAYLEKQKVDKSEERMIKLINQAKDRDSLEKLKKDLSGPEQMMAYDKRWSELPSF